MSEAVLTHEEVSVRSERTLGWAQCPQTSSPDLAWGSLPGETPEAAPARPLQSGLHFQNLIQLYYLKKQARHIDKGIRPPDFQGPGGEGGIFTVLQVSLLLSVLADITNAVLA